MCSACCLRLRLRLGRGRAERRPDRIPLTRRPRILVRVGRVWDWQDGRQSVSVSSSPSVIPGRCVGDTVRVVNVACAPRGEGRGDGQHGERSPNWPTHDARKKPPDCHCSAARARRPLTRLAATGRSRHAPGPQSAHRRCHTEPYTCGAAPRPRPDHGDRMLSARDRLRRPAGTNSRGVIRHFGAPARLNESRRAQRNFLLSNRPAASGTDEAFHHNGARDRAQWPPVYS